MPETIEKLKLALRRGKETRQTIDGATRELLHLTKEGIHLRTATDSGVSAKGAEQLIHRRRIVDDGIEQLCRDTGGPLYPEIEAIREFAQDALRPLRWGDSPVTLPDQCQSKLRTLSAEIRRRVETEIRGFLERADIVDSELVRMVCDYGRSLPLVAALEEMPNGFFDTDAVTSERCPVGLYFNTGPARELVHFLLNSEPLRVEAELGQLLEVQSKWQVQQKESRSVYRFWSFLEDFKSGNNFFPTRNMQILGSLDGEIALLPKPFRQELARDLTKLSKQGKELIRLQKNAEAANRIAEDTKPYDPRKDRRLHLAREAYNDIFTFEEEHFKLTFDSLRGSLRELAARRGIASQTSHRFELRPDTEVVREMLLQETSPDPSATGTVTFESSLHAARAIVGLSLLQKDAEMQIENLARSIVSLGQLADRAFSEICRLQKGSDEAVSTELFSETEDQILVGLRNCFLGGQLNPTDQTHHSELAKDEILEAEALQKDPQLANMLCSLAEIVALHEAARGYSEVQDFFGSQYYASLVHTVESRLGSQFTDILKVDYLVAAHAALNWRDFRNKLTSSASHPEPFLG